MDVVVAVECDGVVTETNIVVDLDDTVGDLRAKISEAAGIRVAGSCTVLLGCEEVVLHCRDAVEDEELRLRPVGTLGITPGDTLFLKPSSELLLSSDRYKELDTTEKVNKLIFAADCSHLVTIRVMNNLKVWDITGDASPCPMVLKLVGAFADVVMPSNMETLVARMWDGTVSVYAFPSGVLLSHHRHSFYHMVALSDCTMVYGIAKPEGTPQDSHTNDRVVSAFDIMTGVRTIPNTYFTPSGSSGVASSVRSYKVSPGEDTVAITYSRALPVCLFSMLTGEQVAQFGKPSGALDLVSFARQERGGDTISAFCEATASVLVWGVASGRQLHCVKLGPRLRGVGATPSYVVACYTDGGDTASAAATVTAFHIDTGKPALRLAFGSARCGGLYISPDARKLAAQKERDGLFTTRVWY